MRIVKLPSTVFFPETSSSRKMYSKEMRSDILLLHLLGWMGGQWRRRRNDFPKPSRPHPQRAQGQHIP